MQIQAIATLSAYLPSKPREQVLQEILEFVQTIAHESSRAQAWAALCQCASDFWQPAFEAVPSIQDARERADVLTAIAERLHGHQTAFCLALLDAAAREERSVALRIITALTDVLREMGGDATMGEIVHAIEDVYRW